MNQVFKSASAWATVPGADERAIHFSALHNVRAALHWCFGADGDAGIGIALTAAAAPIFLAMSLLIECRRWSERALLAIDPSTHGGAEEMHIQAALGLTLMFTRGGSEAARGALSRSLAIAQARGDAPNQLQLLGRMMLWRTSLVSSHSPPRRAGGTSAILHPGAAIRRQKHSP